MTITGDYLLIALILLALGLTIVSFRISLLLFRLAAALVWLTIGIIIWTNQLGTDIADPWVYTLALALLVMVIAVLSLQFKTDIKHEASVRRGLGGPGGGTGANTESWTGWGPKPKQRKQSDLTAMERQLEYKALLKSKRKYKNA